MEVNYNQQSRFLGSNVIHAFANIIPNHPDMVWTLMVL